MKPADYEYLANFLLGTSGLALGAGKEYLIEARLVPLAQSCDLDGIEQLVIELRKGNNTRLSSAVTEAMTTNETSFFRDKKPFEELCELLLPPVLQARQTSQTLRIWCAAAATGQESYSIAMTLLESFPEIRNWNVEIFGTDLDKAALARCKEGVYSQFEVQRGLPVQLLMKYFEQCDAGWRVKDELRSWVRWEQCNLLDDFSRFGNFDIVFCRNVLIYFQNETKKDILDRLGDRVHSDGYLYLGAAETVLGISEAFQRFRDCRSAVYTPSSAAAFA